MGPATGENRTEMKVPTMRIWCCGCGAEVDARLTDGAEIYHHRPDLADLPRWKCDACGNHVGTHHKTKDPTRPLGNIPSPEISNARKHIHALIDPAWKTGRVKRGKLYRMLSAELGYEYHTAEIKSVDEARRVYRVAQSIIREMK
jgi:hypothetical protein